MDKNKWQLIIGLIVAAFGFVATVICGITTVVLHFMNPDMTEYRFLLEYPEYTIVTIVFALITYGGWHLATHATEK